MIFNKFPNYRQSDTKDCGPTCLKIIAKFYKKTIPLQVIRDLSETNREGSNLLNLSEAAKKIGFQTLGLKIDFNTLEKEVPLPCIAHWKSKHYIIIYKIDKKKIYVSDPAFGLIKYSKDEFIKNWIESYDLNELKEGAVLLLEPTETFNEKDWNKNSFKFFDKIEFLSRYLFKYKALIIQLIITLIISSLISIIFPFLTQSIVDVGVNNKNLEFIYIILFAQLMLFLGRLSVEVIRNWTLFHLSSRINISLISDFFIKLMNLPISFFDTRMTGDILQRINDHNRIEKLLTNTSLNTLFSMINVLVLGGVLAYYNLYIFLVFFVGSLSYLLWIFLFLKRRKELDYKKFSSFSQEQSKVIELINGMQEIKLQNAERKKRWEWEFIQVKLFNINIKSLHLEQIQNTGANFIIQTKDIFITFLSAYLVIKGELTLGVMLSIQYIVGQINSPLSQLVNFIQETQEAKISLDRLAEIHNKEDEEPNKDNKIYKIINEDLILDNISFKYPGGNDFVLKNLNTIIPSKKITAIVGASGSGKTTLMKLLLKFYNISDGNIKIGNINLNEVSQKSWRDSCGVVMQDGYVFNDTIANNIVVNEDVINDDKLEKSVNIANIKDFIKNLPFGYNTKIGNEGLGISGGQKQRLMIARAVYKNPDFIFFDEATSSLDTINEKIIMENLNLFFKGKTVMVIAHRLSTVRNADKIIVMDNGKIKEEGSHDELIQLKSVYYNLVKDQLNLEK